MDRTRQFHLLVVTIYILSYRPIILTASHNFVAILTEANFIRELSCLRDGVCRCLGYFRLLSLSELLEIGTWRSVRFV